MYVVTKTDIYDSSLNQVKVCQERADAVAYAAILVYEQREDFAGEVLRKLLTLYSTGQWEEAIKYFNSEHHGTLIEHTHCSDEEISRRHSSDLEAISHDATIQLAELAEAPAPSLEFDEDE